MSRKSLPFEISRAEIAEQRADIFTTAQHHGINERNTVIVGGAGLALHGLFTAVPMFAEKMPKNGRSPFDVDAVVAPGSDRWQKGLFGRDRLHYDANAEAPLPVTLIRGHAARAFAYSGFGYASLEAMVADHENIDGLGVLSLRGILQGKILGGSSAPGTDRVKDRVGVLGAHLIASEYDNPVVENPHWQSAVRAVVHRLDPTREDAPIVGVDPMLPKWVNDLRMNGFDHQAFDGIRNVTDKAA